MTGAERLDLIRQWAVLLASLEQEKQLGKERKQQEKLQRPQCLDGAQKAGQADAAVGRQD